MPEPTKIPIDTRTSDPLPVGAAALPNLVHLERCSLGRADDGPLRRASYAGALVPAHHKVGTAVLMAQDSSIARCIIVAQTPSREWSNSDTKKSFG